VRRNLWIATFFLLGPNVSPAAAPGRPAERAFESYVANLEAGVARQYADPSTHIAAFPFETATGSDAERELIGAVRVNGGGWPVEGSLLHHWRGVTFVPRATANDMLKLLRDYNNLSRYYAPEVVSSRILSDNGATSRIAMRFEKRVVIKVVLDAEFQVESGLSAGRGYSVSRSTHIWQIDQPGTMHERRRPEAECDGFLWRLNSYWRFEQHGDGLIIDCETVSLTRAAPAALRWLISPVITALPRDSLQFTLTATKNALAANTLGRYRNGRAN